MFFFFFEIMLDMYIQDTSLRGVLLCMGGDAAVRIMRGGGRKGRAFLTDR